MTDQLLKRIVGQYDPDDTNFAAKANAEVEKYFAGLKPSKSAKDPNRLGSRAVFYTHLRTALLDAAGPMEFGTKASKEFDEMSPREQLKFQAAARVAGEPKWILDVELIPQNIQDVRMPLEEVVKLKKARAKIDAGKLREDMKDVEGDKLIQTLIAPLENQNADWQTLATGLMLATGRRTIEVLKTGDFYLAGDMTNDGYEAMFSGQAKAGLEEGAPYRIPLLAPFQLVHDAFTRLRALVNTEDKTNAQVNLSYARTINNRLGRLPWDLNAHELRALYAMMTYKLESKMSLVGWISKVLGHANTSNAAFYQRLNVIDFTGPFVPETPTEEAPAIPAGWKARTVPEQNRVESIQKYMAYRKKITASALRRFGGGSMALIEKVMANNKALIDAFNASL